MEPITQDKAHHQAGREGLTARERQQQRDETQFGETASGARIQQLERTVETHDRWISGIKGQNGVRVTGNIVELEHPQGAGEDAEPQSAGPQTVFMVVVDDGAGNYSAHRASGPIKLLT